MRQRLSQILILVVAASLFWGGPLRFQSAYAAGEVQAVQGASKVIAIQVSEVLSTQPSVGWANVDSTLTNLAKASKSTEEFVNRVIEAVATKPIPGVQAPALDGTAPGLFNYIYDSHHRAGALAKLLYRPIEDLPAEVRKFITPQVQAALRTDSRLTLKVEVTATYTSREDFIVRGLLVKGKGYLYPGMKADPVLAKAINTVKQAAGKLTTEAESVQFLKTGLSSEELGALMKVFENLGSKIHLLRDDPLRSAVGQAFYRAGIDSRYFDDYVEFFVAELLRPYKRVLLVGDPVGPETTKRVIRSIFENPDVLEYLRAVSRSGFGTEARTNLAAALARYKLANPVAASSGFTSPGGSTSAESAAGGATGQPAARAPAAEAMPRKGSFATYETNSAPLRSGVAKAPIEPSVPAPAAPKAPVPAPAAPKPTVKAPAVPETLSVVEGESAVAELRKLSPAARRAFLARSVEEGVLTAEESMAIQEALMNGRKISTVLKILKIGGRVAIVTGKVVAIAGAVFAVYDGIKAGSAAMDPKASTGKMMMQFGSAAGCTVIDDMGFWACTLSKEFVSDLTHAREYIEKGFIAMGNDPSMKGSWLWDQVHAGQQSSTNSQAVSERPNKPAGVMWVVPVPPEVLKAVSPVK